MKIPKVVVLALVFLVPAAIVAGIFFFRSRPEPEQVFRANLAEAQKMLVTLRRAEMVYGQGPGVSPSISARKTGSQMIYSPGWRSMKLPNAEANTGFDYECIPATGSCQATEAGKTGPTVSGIRIDIQAGSFSCLGSYKPVTTQGFDGAPVVVGCQAS